MKFILLSLLLTTVAFASETEKSEKNLWPRVSAYSNGVDVVINNYTDKDYSCQGSVYITHESGRTSTEYYSARVYAGMYERHHYFNRRFRDPIRRAHDSIRCYEL
ncbi:MAG: hypothetical protein CME62_05040 [Halobacteriovoraceae bacterium]|nr:hypothetical protein [Halobacteriovoraceae bacterium]|tara:strand:- start:2738 stop:3052 length:315 start_codon:yes stop_codon:yes gene_type:complete